MLEAIERLVEMGYADPTRVAVLGGSHGGFLAAHLIGQVRRGLEHASRHPGKLGDCGLSLVLRRVEAAPALMQGRLRPPGRVWQCSFAPVWPWL